MAIKLSENYQFNVTRITLTAEHFNLNMTDDATAETTITLPATIRHSGVKLFRGDDLLVLPATITVAQLEAGQIELVIGTPANYKGFKFTVGGEDHLFDPDIDPADGDAYYTFGSIDEDFLRAGTGDDILYGGDGDDTLHGGKGDGNDILYGGNGTDTLNGGAGDDTLLGGNGTDTLNGGAGDDTLLGGNGGDTLIGGAGNDTASYIYSYTGVTVSLDISGQEQVGRGYARGDHLISIENLQGSRHGDQLTGSSGDNVLYGNGGDDRLYGGDGDDTLHGGDGDDTLRGGDGNDTLRGGEGNDRLRGGEGKDDLYGGLGSNIFGFSDGEGHDTVHDFRVGIDRLHLYTSDPVEVEFREEGEKHWIVFKLSQTDSIKIEGNVSTDFESVLAGSTRVITLIQDENVSNTILSDTIVVGTRRDNTINGGEGVDHLYGGAGNDELHGGRGDDILNGGLGNDTLNGGDGNDTLNGGSGSDTLNGGRGIDTLNGGSHRDILKGGEEDDILNGYAGDDTLNGGSGADTLDGGVGIDTASYDGSIVGVTVSLADGDAQSIENNGDASGDILSNIENLYGSAHDDKLTGSSGNNTLNGGSGADTLDGGAGIDTASYDGSSVGVTVSLTIADGQEQAIEDNGDASGDMLSNIENLYGSAYGDKLTGSSENNELYGGGGNDKLHGGRGDDTLDGGSGVDELWGGAGKDTFVFGYGHNGYGNIIHDFEVGIDHLKFTTYYDVKIEYLDNEGIDNDWIEFKHQRAYEQSGSIRIKGNRDTNLGDVLAGSPIPITLIQDGTTDLIYVGIETADTFFGDNGNDKIYGGKGDDILIGGAGYNKLYGGDGDDKLAGGDSADIFDGGEGIDAVGYFSSSVGVTVSLAIADGDEQVSAGNANGDRLSSIENLYGSAHRDTLTGSSGKNVLYGEAGIDILRGLNGDDTLWGGDGDDTLWGGEDNDILNGGEDNDILNGGEDNDILNGGEGRDTLNGGEGNDILNGGAGVFDNLWGGGGNDILNGGAGVDKLYGGAGSDIFVFGHGDGRDTVYDEFIVGDDHLQLITDADVAVEYHGDYQIEFKLSETDSIKILGNRDTDLKSVIAESSMPITLVIDNTDDIVSVGTSGNDILNGRKDNDILTGRAGDDTLNGGKGVDTLWGGEDDDTLNGGEGVDTLNGGEGVDTLNGGAGDDILTGGAGGDFFILSLSLSADGKNGLEGRDTITDFTIGEDTIRGEDKIRIDTESGGETTLEALGIYFAKEHITTESGSNDLSEFDLVIYKKLPPTTDGTPTRVDIMVLEDFEFEEDISDLNTYFDTNFDTYFDIV